MALISLALGTRAAPRRQRKMSAKAGHCVVNPEGQVGRRSVTCCNRTCARRVGTSSPSRHRTSKPTNATPAPVKARAGLSEQRFRLIANRPRGPSGWGRDRRGPTFARFSGGRCARLAGSSGGPNERLAGSLGGLRGCLGEPPGGLHGRLAGSPGALCVPLVGHPCVPCADPFDRPVQRQVRSFRWRC